MIDTVSALYGLKASRIERHFQSGTKNRSYLIASAEGEFVLRANKRHDPDHERALSFQLALYEMGGPVSTPVLSRNSRFIEPIEDGSGQELYVSLLRYVLGKTHTMIPKGGLNVEQCFGIGKSIAQLHTTMKKVGHDRFDFGRWESGENCFSFEPSAGSDADDPIVIKYLQQKSRCLAKHDPQQAIHGDMHFDNIILTDDGVVFCDFDNVCVGDVKMDLALLLLDLPIVADPSEDWATINQLANAILVGYSCNGHDHAIELKNLSEYQKLLEIGLYLECRQYADLCAGDGWIPRFFRDRKRRIMDDVEYWEERAT
jgi:Ser/Thr protein kinase RdoA (MazF antagonist)